MVDFHSQRPGHDLRYALDGNKMKNMGWTPDSAYDKLESTIEWTLKNDRVANYLMCLQRLYLKLKFKVRFLKTLVIFLSIVNAQSVLNDISDLNNNDLDNLQEPIKV